MNVRVYRVTFYHLILFLCLICDVKTFLSDPLYH